MVPEDEELEPDEEQEEEDRQGEQLKQELEQEQKDLAWLIVLHRQVFLLPFQQPPVPD